MPTKKQKQAAARQAADERKFWESLADLSESKRPTEQTYTSLAHNPTVIVGDEFEIQLSATALLMSAGFDVEDAR